MPESNAPKTMTVRELKDYLYRFPDDLLVLRSVPSRDYWGTELALSLNDIDTKTVQHDSYHSCFSVPRTDRDQQDDDEFTPQRYEVLLLG